MTDETQACLGAFNTVCSYIGTREIVQEHITFRVLPLVNEWEMLKIKEDSLSKQGVEKGLKYTYQYKSQFGHDENG